MKQRFTALDVHCVVEDLRPRILGMRVANVYDINAKTYLFKLARGDDKVFLLVESGTRLHSTDFAREKSNTPSGFTMKLRKHLRTRRLTNIRQIGVDRVVDLEFGGGSEYAFHLLCEFYASGNIVLTDAGYTILSLLRVVQPEESVRFAVREQYPVSILKSRVAEATPERLREVLRSAGPADTLKKVLASVFDYGAPLLEHAVLMAGVDPELRVAERFDSSEGSPQFDGLLAALREVEALYYSSTPSRGYVSIRESPKTSAGAAPLETYEDFQPLLLAQNKGRKVIDYESFDRACDEFFSQAESQKADLKTHAHEAQALKKIEAVRKDHQARVRNLQAAQQTNEHKAELIKLHLQAVEEAINVVRVALANSMQWSELRDLVQEQRARGNPIARIIDKLKFESNQITLLLEEPAAEDDEDYNSDEDFSDEEASNTGKKRKRVAVDIDLTLSAFANANAYFGAKKASALKEQKTLNASEMAIKSAEKKITREMRQVQVATSINRIRKPLWFEKFLWFISSENYLIIAGRDMQQNELLVKRHLRKGDLYVHADLHGAASVVIKNPSGQPVSPVTLAQAGSFAVCLSSAWDSKVVVSAWWVEHHQVSKTAPTGEYLTTGSFVIRGKKNFLPPTQLIMGFGVLFRVDESCIPAHLHERRPRIDAAEADRSSRYSLEPSPAAVAAAAAAALAKADEEEEVELEADLSENVSSAMEADNERDQEDATMDGGDQSGDEAGGGGGDDDEEEEEAAFPDTSVPTAFTTALRSLSAGRADPAPAAAPEEPALHEQDRSDDEDDESAGAGKQAPSGARHMSASERRLHKRAAELNISVEELRAQKAQSTPAPRQAASPPEPKQRQPAPVRGKRGKQKKLKDKYAEQDEEDRELAMRLLAPAKAAPPPPAPKAKQQPGKQQKQQQQNKGPKANKSKAAAGAFSVPADSDTQQEAQAHVAEEQQELPDDGANEAEKEEIKRLLAEENITVLEEDELNSLTILDSLTGQPNASDVLLYAVPFCAPYSALASYKYKVKLTPGTAKKGKAARAAVALFTRLPDASPREKELLKSIPETELIAQMLGKVKLMVAAGSR